MTKEQANQIHKGAVVIFLSERCIVQSVKTSGMSAPYFRLYSEKDGHPMIFGGEIAHRLVSLPADYVEIVKK
jgi:hypothetical protein